MSVEYYNCCGYKDTDYEQCECKEDIFDYSQVETLNRAYESN